MQITDFLAQLGGLQSMARELGTSEAQVASGAEALIPAILGGFKKQVQTQPTGLEGLGGLLEQFGGGNLLDQVLAPQPTDVSRGNEVLDQIFGDQDVSRAVAQNAAVQSGVDVALLKKMLPLLAMLLTGFLAKQRETGVAAPSAPNQGGLGDLLGTLLRGQATGNQGTGSVTSGLAAMLDLNGDGNALDDVLRMVGKVIR
jgi:hypothetical protein